MKEIQCNTLLKLGTERLPFSIRVHTIITQYGRENISLWSILYLFYHLWRFSINLYVSKKSHARKGSFSIAYENRFRGNYFWRVGCEIYFFSNDYLFLVRKCFRDYESFSETFSPNFSFSIVLVLFIWGEKGIFFESLLGFEKFATKIYPIIIE